MHNTYTCVHKLQIHGREFKVAKGRVVKNYAKKGTLIEKSRNVTENTRYKNLNIAQNYYAYLTLRHIKILST